ncbi:hypothetical protein ACLMNI_001170 [Campylobacter upsaliensis]|uniref:hypothetical protein n=1 Tax=Campylobacter upsaliensis TaxID=28080 RepID=UPI000AB199DD|nr:hypothetical protein [Campylobacter upsaliensis]
MKGFDFLRKANSKLNTALRDGLGFRCSKFNGVIWLNAEHLGGRAFSFCYF